MSLITFFILALATWRLASLLADEQGPYSIFSRFRYWAGERRGVDGRIAGNQFAKGLMCVWCVSVWVSIILSTLWCLWPGSVIISTPFALSAVACIVNDWMER